MINDWNLGFNAYAWIRNNVAGFHSYTPTRIIELGSGEVSELLSIDYHITSIEHNPKYIKKDNFVQYIHAPIKDGWYDLSEPFKDYDLLIIDGPTGKIGRSGILNHLDLFDLSKPILLDDVHRPAEFGLSSALSKAAGRPAQIFPDGKKQFAII